MEGAGSDARRPARPAASGGYVTSIAGGVVGAPLGAAAAWIALRLAGWLERGADTAGTGLDQALFVLVVLVGSTIAAQAIGVYAGLRIGSHAHAGTTAALAAVLGVLVVWFTQGAGAIVLLFLPALARWIDRRLRSRFADAGGRSVVGNGH